MKSRFVVKTLTLFVVASLNVSGVRAQTPAQPASTASAATPKPVRTHALVSAVGDQFTYVRQKEVTGSNVIDNFTRKVVKVPNNILNNAVLRALDRAINTEDPTSERVYITLAPAELEGVLPQDREAAAIGKLVTAIEKMPERMNWDKVYVVTPKFLFSEYTGMGSKLQGFGVYVQPLSSATIQGDGNEFELGQEIDASGFGESDSTTPDGEGTKSKRYVAPFSYISTYVLDAKTLKVLEKNNRHDFQKLFDPMSTALDVANSIPTEFLAARIARLVERSVGKSVRDIDDKARIEVGDVKPVAKPAEPKK